MRQATGCLRSLRSVQARCAGLEQGERTRRGHGADLRLRLNILHCGLLGLNVLYGGLLGLNVLYGGLLGLHVLYCRLLLNVLDGRLLLNVLNGGPLDRHIDILYLWLLHRLHILHLRLRGRHVLNLRWGGCGRDGVRHRHANLSPQAHEKKSASVRWQCSRWGARVCNETTGYGVCMGARHRREPPPPSAWTGQGCLPYGGGWGRGVPCYSHLTWWPVGVESPKTRGADRNARRVDSRNAWAGFRVLGAGGVTAGRHTQRVRAQRTVP